MRANIKHFSHAIANMRMPNLRLCNVVTESSLKISSLSSCCHPLKCCQLPLNNSPLTLASALCLQHTYNNNLRVCVCVGGGWLFLLLLSLLLTNVLLLVSIQDAALHWWLPLHFVINLEMTIKILSNSIVPTCWRETLSQCTSRVGMRCMWTMQRRGQTPRCQPLRVSRRLQW